MFVSERPRYYAATGRSLLHFLAAAGTAFALLGTFSVPVQVVHIPPSSERVLEIRPRKFLLGHASRLFCRVFFFFIGVSLARISAPRFSHVFQFFSTCPPFRLLRVLNLFQCQTLPLAWSDIDTDRFV